MVRSFKQLLFFLLLGAAVLWLLYQGFLYLSARDALPVGMTMGGIDVGGLSAEDAVATLEAHYYAPVRLNFREQSIELDPLQVGFMLDTEGMLADATAWRDEEEPAIDFVRFVLDGRFLPSAEIPIQATHDSAELDFLLDTVTSVFDQPAKMPRFSTTFLPGETGYLVDMATSRPDVEAALYQPDQRTVTLAFTEEEPPEFDINFLEASLRRQLEGFDGVGSVYILDLETGEEVSINADMSLSGLSILKIGIFVEAYRALDGPPDARVQQLLFETATQSSNYGANILMELAAGIPNTYEGAAVFTESMWRLGLVNTFMAIPYDASAVETRPSTFTTPANSRGDSLFLADPARQTTAAEIGQLLAMLYYCSQGGGTLLAVYPDAITPEECQEIIDLMVLNEEGNLIRFGVPNDVPVSHKHGWDGSTHGDAGIVYSPNRDFVIVTYLHEQIDWLVADTSFPILREMARITYNYFNYDDPYLGDALFEEDRFEEDDAFFEAVREAAAEAGIEDIESLTQEELLELAETLELEGEAVEDSAETELPPEP
jgi:beta-lactamase class A